MSALAMILTAAIAVPGNGPEMVSGEVVEEPQPLNLSGKWDMSLFSSDQPPSTWKNLDSETLKFGLEITDEGKGRLRMTRKSGTTFLGIYRQEQDRIIISFRVREKGYPTDYSPNKEKIVIILHRAKPRK